MGDRRVSPPNYTQLPNQLLDEVMPDVGTLAELKVTLAIARQTFGWHREEQLVSLTQLEQLTGLSRQSVQAGVQAALERGFVGRRQKGKAYVYGLRVKNLGSSPDARQDTCLPTRQVSRPGTNKGKKTLKKNSTPKPPGGVDSEGDDAGQQLQHPPGPDELTRDSVVQEVFDAWRVGTGKNGGSKLDPRRRRKLELRLADAIEDGDGSLATARKILLTAVEGMCKSGWHRENGHLNFEQLFRDYACVEKFRIRREAQVEKESSNGAGPSDNPEYDTTRANPEVEELQRRASDGDQAAIKECEQFGIEF